MGHTLKVDVLKMTSGRDGRWTGRVGANGRREQRETPELGSGTVFMVGPFTAEQWGVGGE